MCEKLPSLPLKGKVRDGCRKQLTMAPLPRSESEEVIKSGEEDGASSEGEEVFHQQESLQPESVFDCHWRDTYCQKEAITIKISQTEGEKN